MSINKDKRDVEMSSASNNDENDAIDQNFLKDAESAVKAMMIEVLPVHERLSFEAALFDKKTQLRMHELRKPIYVSGRVIRSMFIA